VTAVDGSAWSTRGRQRSYTEAEIFTDEEVARQFRIELLRLVEHGVSDTRAGASGTDPGVAAEDRWAKLPGGERAQHRPAAYPQATARPARAHLVPARSGW
jgi:hypothetical protein